jgi:hypothetical protein
MRIAKAQEARGKPSGRKLSRLGSVKITYSARPTHGNFARDRAPLVCSIGSLHFNVPLHPGGIRTGSKNYVDLRIAPSSDGVCLIRDPPVQGTDFAYRIGTG